MDYSGFLSEYFDGDAARDVVAARLRLRTISP